MSQLLRVGLWVCFVVAGLAPGAVGQTAFNYQGELRDEVGFASGSMGMTFTLWDAPNGGMPLGTNRFDGIELPRVEVAEGRFNVMLNFDLGVFNGDPRWLEIEVEGELLTPRHPIPPTPYAFHANVAGSFLSTANLQAAQGALGGVVVPNNTLSVYGILSVDSDDQNDGAHLPGLRFGLSSAETIASKRTPGGNQFGLDFYTGGNNRLAISRQGFVGINTTVPQERLHVAGDVLADESFQAASGGIGGAPAPGNALSVYGIVSVDSGDQNNGTHLPGLRFGLSGAETIASKRTAGGNQFGLDFYTGGNNRLAITAEGRVGIGTTAPEAKLHVIGTTRTTVMEITGADLAEKFPVTEEVEPGMVLEIAPQSETPGTLRLAREPYSKLVAGVVSGANGLPAGTILGNLPGSEHYPPVALSGRVWVHCDARYGSIEPGDLLTTSQTPGHAMKVVDHDAARGASLGKAMTALTAGERGLVLVLVGLQ